MGPYYLHLPVCGPASTIPHIIRELNLLNIRKENKEIPKGRGNIEEKVRVRIVT